MNIKNIWNHHLELLPGPSSLSCAKRFRYFEQKSPSLWVAFGTCLGRWLVESYWKTLELSTSHDAGVTMKSMNHVTGTSDGEHWNDQNLIHDNTTVHFWSQYMQLILWPNRIPCECVFLFSSSQLLGRNVLMCGTTGRGKGDLVPNGTTHPKISTWTFNHGDWM